MLITLERYTGWINLSVTETFQIQGTLSLKTPHPHNPVPLSLLKSLVWGLSYAHSQ